MNDKLTYAIQMAKDRLAADEDAVLPRGYREAIWAAYGPLQNSKDIRENPGWQRRTHLAVLAAKHVLPIWDKRFHRKKTPLKILALIMEILAGKADLKKANESTIVHLLDEIDCMPALDNGYLIQADAGISMHRALETALWDERFDPDKVDLDMADFDVDAEDYDSSFFAANVYANGISTASDPDSDPTKRREF